MSRGKLVLAGDARVQLLWRCARVGKAWADFTRARDEATGGTPLPLIRQLYRAIQGLAREQAVDLGISTETEFLQRILGGPAGDWLEGGGSERILVARTAGRWQLLPYGRRLIGSVKPIQTQHDRESAQILACCAMIAVNWNNEVGRSEGERFFSQLSRCWRERTPPAPDLLGLLVWPASWWLLGAPAMAFLQVDDDGQVLPTEDARDLVDDDVEVRPLGRTGEFR